MLVTNTVELAVPLPTDRLVLLWCEYNILIFQIHTSLTGTNNFMLFTMTEYDQNNWY